jgi:homoserine dehydrogenase
MKKVKVGIIGFGTIGAGVVMALKSKRALLKARSGIDISIAAICDKDLKTRRPVKVDKKLLTRSIGRIMYDPDIDIVVELVGGITPTKDMVLEALRQGKHVVTANKALLSEAGGEIFALANALGLTVGFEASVGGGVPIIRSLKESFIADRIDLIYGIINGTSNFILSRMAEESISFADALKLAQDKGYAERDPRLDISGGDSAHKLSILALLGFGVKVKPADIYTEGITGIEQDDIEYAKEMGYAIKLLAIAKRSGKSLELRVHPTLIPSSRLLAGVSGVYNAIFVKGDLVGDNLFYGKGAGAEPTSSAVVSDIVAIAKAMAGGSRKIEDGIIINRDIDGIKKMDRVTTRHYIKFLAVDKPGVLTRISGILAKNDISIASVTQKERKAGDMVPIVMMTHEAAEKDMAKALKEIGALKIVRKKLVRIRVED